MATLHWTRCRLLMVALALFCLQWHWHSADALRVDANSDLSAADDAALLSNDQLQSLSSPSAVTMMPLQLGGAGAGNMKAHFQADFPAVQLGQDTRTATAADDDSPTSISASFSQNQVVNATGPLIDATPLSDDSGVPVSPDNINVDLFPARIVSSLGSGGKRKRFVENSQSTYDNRVGHAVDTLDQADPVFQQLAQKYRDMQQDMINDKHWIEDVKSIINHYQAKIKSVQTNMKTVAKQAENIKKAVYSRHEYNHQKVLEQQLKDIQLQLNNMHYQARSMVGQAKVLDKIKSSLRQSMQTIEQEMTKIQSKAASSDAAVMAASHM